MKPSNLPLFAVCAVIALHPCEARKKSAPQTPSAGRASAPIISSELSGKDYEFLANVSDIGKVEVWLGAQASRAEADQIKALSQPLVEAQPEEDKFLKQLAQLKGVDLSRQPDPGEVKKPAAQFGALKDVKFDKALLEKIAAVNRREVTEFEAAARSSDPDIKQFAERVLPVAKEKLLLFDKITGSAQRTTVTPAFRTDTAVRRNEQSKALRRGSPS